MRLCGRARSYAVSAGAGRRQFGQDFPAMFRKLQTYAEQQGHVLFGTGSQRTRNEFLKWAENHPSIYVVEQEHGRFKLVDCWGL